jgi:hypothetical protein
MLLDVPFVFALLRWSHLPVSVADFASPANLVRHRVVNSAQPVRRPSASDPCSDFLPVPVRSLPNHARGSCLTSVRLPPFIVLYPCPAPVPTFCPSLPDLCQPCSRHILDLARLPPGAFHRPISSSFESRASSAARLILHSSYIYL